MSSVFNSLQKNWSFISDSDFVAFVTLGSDTYPVFYLEIITSLSSNYTIDLLILTTRSLDSQLVEEQLDISVKLFSGDLEKSFSGSLISFAFQGTSFSLSSPSSNSDSSSSSIRNVYKLSLVPSLWNGTKTQKTIIFHESSKSSVIESVIQNYNVSLPQGLPQAAFETLEVITQYQETDFSFIIRLLEELGCFSYYDFTSLDASFAIQSASAVSSSTSSVTLNVVSEIHDNFNFNQVVDFKLFDLALTKDRKHSAVDDSDTNSSYSHFSCQCTDYSLFAGQVFSVRYETFSHSSDSLFSPSLTDFSFFIERSKLVLAYEQSIGWFIRNDLEGVALKNGSPVYFLNRTTSTPFVDGPQQAYVCGVTQNSVYVNSEGKLRVRLGWIPFISQTEAQQSAANNLAKAKLEADLKKQEAANKSLESGQILLADSASSAVEPSLQNAIGDAISKNSGVGLDFANTISTGVKLGNLQTYAASQLTGLAQEALQQQIQNAADSREQQLAFDKKYANSEDYVEDSSAIWSVNHSDSRALTGWIPLAQWGGAGDYFGNYSFPRVSQQVIVTFIDGNPDRPIISGTCFSLEKPFPFSQVQPAATFSAPSSSLQTDSISDAMKNEASSAFDLASDPSKILDKLEGIDVPDLSSVENTPIEASSGNVVLRSFSYDDQNRTNRAGWNEISFFNIRYQEAMRLSSAHYIFLQSRDIVNIEAPKLLRMVVGIHHTQISGNRYFLVSGKSNEFYGADRISYFSQISTSSTNNQSLFGEEKNGMIAERLQTEVTGKLMAQLGHFAGKQIFSTIMNDGLRIFISFMGDYVALILGGLIEYTAIGAFNLNCNAATFAILGTWKANIMGGMTFNVARSVEFDVVGKIAFLTASSFTARSLGKANIQSSSAVDLIAAKSITATAGKSIDMRAGSKVSMIAGGAIELKSAASMSISVGGNLSINATSISISSSTMLSCRANAVLKLSSSGIVNISGSLIKLGPGG